MPAGKHTSVRVALAVPPRLHEQLSEWADYDGRPLASLCMYLIEQSLRQAQRDGIPPFGKEEQDELDTSIAEYAAANPGRVHVKEVMKNTRTMNDKEFEEYFDDQYKDLKPGEEPSGEDLQRMSAIRASQGIGKKVGKLTRAMESSPERPDMPPEALAAGAAAALGMAVGGPLAGAAAAVGAGVVLNKREQLVADLLNLLKPDTAKQVVDAVKTDEDVDGLQKFIGASIIQDSLSDELMEELEEQEKSTKGKGKK